MVEAGSPACLCSGGELVDPDGVEPPFAADWVGDNVPPGAGAWEQDVNAELAGADGSA